MPIESATYIHQLNHLAPDINDPRGEGDDHIRTIKNALKNTFPNVQGAILRSDAELNKAPYNRATLEALLGVGLRSVTSGTFSDAQVADISLGWITAKKRLRAIVGGNFITEPLAFLSDVASGAMLNDIRISLGGGLELHRYTSYGSPGDQFTITFFPAFSEIPWMIIPTVYNGADATAYGGYPPFASHSIGGTVSLRDRTKTNVGVSLRSSVAGGTMRFSLYVLGKV